MLNKKVVNKRLKSTKEYVDELQNKYSKLCVVRLDFGYKKPHSDTIVLGEANDDLNKMLNNRRCKPSIFKDQVGYICKKEYTKDKGMHIHAVFFYNGNKIKKDDYKAKQIGEYWQNEITQDKGTFHSCHRNKYEHNGIGMLEHNDREKRKNLDKAISYLCKEDYQELKKANKKDRAFTRGIVSKKKSTRGRPRKKTI